MTFMGGSTKMTQDDFKEAMERQKQVYQGMLNQVHQNYQGLHAAQNAAQNAAANPYKSLGGFGQWASASQQIPQYYLEERERQEIREHEREACVRIVMDMAEELNCPNLLHGVALAIKARSDLKLTKY